MPTAPRGRGQEAPTYFPASCNYKNMHSEYVKPSGNLRVMGYRAFVRLWMSKCKSTKFFKTFWYNMLPTLHLHDNSPRRSLNNQHCCRRRWCKSTTPLKSGRAAWSHLRRYTRTSPRGWPFKFLMIAFSRMLKGFAGHRTRHKMFAALG